MQILLILSFIIGVGYIFLSFFANKINKRDIWKNNLWCHPTVIAVFFTVFGGVGIISMTRGNNIYAMVIAGACGFCIAHLFYRFFVC